MADYAVYLHESLLEQAPRSRRNRGRIMEFVRGLGRNPGLRGDYEVRDATGRCMQVKVIGAFAITYWADHAAREIKVVNLQLADPR